MGLPGIIGQVSMYGGVLQPPTNWAYCDGQLLSTKQYPQLFSIIGTTYGGDGRTTFGLPDLRGRIPVGAGQAPGLKDIELGEHEGSEHTALSVSNLPSHNHGVTAALHFVKEQGVINSPGEAAFAITNFDNEDYQMYQTDPPTEGAMMNQNTIGGTSGNAGSGTEFSTLQPYLVTRYIICLTGFMPG